MNAAEPQAGAIPARCAVRRPIETGEHAASTASRGPDLHHLGRSRTRRRPDPPCAGTAARRAGGEPRHLAVRGAKVPREGRRFARRAQRSSRGEPRAQARHSRLADVRHVLWRQRRVHRRLVAIPIAVMAMFTRMNTPHNVGNQGVQIAERATQAAIAYARAGAIGRAGSADRTRRWHHRTPDVRRLLGRMKAPTEGARATATTTADRARPRHAGVRPRRRGPSAW